MCPMVEEGADVATKNGKGQTAIDLARRDRHFRAEERKAMAELLGRLGIVQVLERVECLSH